MKFVMRKLSKIFFTSDHHFYQSNSDFRCHSNMFGMTKEELDEHRVKEWNNVVKKNDIVYYVGDFCDGNVLQLINLKNRLNGKIILVRGNHDNLPVEAYEAIFDGVVDFVELPKFNIVAMHFPSIDQISDIKKHGQILIYGHIHEDVDPLPMIDKKFCCCVEKTGNAPVELSKILDVVS